MSTVLALDMALGNGLAPICPVCGGTECSSMCTDLFSRRTTTAVVQSLEIDLAFTQLESFSKHFLRFGNILYILMGDIPRSYKVTSLLTYLSDYCGLREIGEILDTISSCMSRTQSLESVFESLEDDTTLKTLVATLLFVVLRPFYPKAGDSWIGTYLNKFAGKIKIKPISFNFYDIFIWISKIFVIFLDKGYNFYATGKFESSIGECQSIDEWVEQVTFISGSSIELSHIECPDDEHKMTRTEYQSRLYDLIEIGEKFLVAPEHKSRFNFIHTQLKSLRALIDSFHLRERNEGSRTAPLGILVQGGSGIGKSSVVDEIITSFHAISHPHVTFSENMVYTRQATDEYWNNFRSQPYLKFDDLGATRVEVNKGNDVAEVIQTMNEVPFIPNQAAIEDKGKYACRAELVVGTSNLKEFNTSKIFTFPIAAIRRFKYLIEVKVKSDFAYTDEGAVFVPNKRKARPTEAGVDQSKVAQWMLDNQTEVVPDIHSYKIYLVKSTGDAIRADYQLLYEMDVKREFLRALHMLFSQHQMGLDLKRKVDMAVFAPKCFHGVPSDSCYRCNLYKTLNADVWHGTVIRNAIIPRVQSSTRGYSIYDVFYSIWQWFKDVYITLRHFGVYHGCIACVALSPSVSAKMIRVYKAQQLNLERFYGTLNYYRNVIVAKLSNPQALLVFIGGVAAAAAWKLSSSDEPAEAQSEEIDAKWRAPTHKDENSPWNNKSSTQFIPNDSPIRSISQGKIQELVQKRTAKIHCFATHSDMLASTGKMYSGVAFKIGTNIWCTAAHLIVKDLRSTTGINCWLHMEIKSNHQNAFVSHDINLVDSILYFLPEKDIVLIYDACGQATRDLSRFLRDKDDYGENAQRSSLVTPDEIVDTGISKVVKTALPMCYKARCGYVRSGKGVTEKGMSGSPWIVETPANGWCVYGPHSFLYNVDSPAANHLMLKDFNDALDHFRKENYVIQAFVQEASTLSDRLTGPSKYNRLQYETFPICEYYGTFENGKRVKMKTSFYPLPWKETVEARLGKTDFGIPDYTSYKGEAYLDAFKHNIVARTDYKHSFPTEQLRRASDNYLKRFQHLKPRRVAPLSLDDAINGIDGVPFIDSLNMSTSAGYPYNCKKKDLMIPITGSDRLELGPRLYADYCVFMKLVSSNVVPDSLFKATVKDELRKLDRILIRKYRIFTAGNAVLLLAMRKFFLPVASLLHTHMFISEMAIGINATGPMWGTLREYLLSLGVNIINGDFATYDAGMNAQVMREGIRILIKIAKDVLLYTDEECHAMAILGEVICNALVAFDGEIMRFLGSNPSGQFLTAIINGLVNSLYNRMAFDAQYPTFNFNKKVRLMTYGDDNAMGVSPACPNFNQMTLSAFLKLFGITYTNAAKQQFTEKYTPVAGLDFLKRTFVKRAGVVYAPLAKGSILKSLCFGRRSEEMSQETYMGDTLLNYLREMTQYGIEEYRAAFFFAQELQQQFLPKEYHVNLPQWEQIYDGKREYPLIFKVSEYLL